MAYFRWAVKSCRGTWNGHDPQPLQHALDHRNNLWWKGMIAALDSADRQAGQIYRHRTKRVDPGWEDTLCEVVGVDWRLRFRDLPPSQRVVDGAGPIIRRMVEYMKEKQLTVKDLFALIDTDRSMTISTDELFLERENADQLEILWAPCVCDAI